MNEILSFLSNNEFLVVLIVVAIFLIVIALVLIFTKEEKYVIPATETFDETPKVSVIDSLVEIPQEKQLPIEPVTIENQPEIVEEKIDELENTMSRIEPISEIKYVEEGLEKTQALYELEKITEELKKREQQEIEEIKKLIPEQQEIQTIEQEIVETPKVLPVEETQLVQESMPQPQIIVELPTIIEPQVVIEQQTEEITSEVLDKPELSKFELEQEANAIIDLDEYLQLGEKLHQSNEFHEYEEEEDIPITIQELEEKMNQTLQLAYEEQPVVEVIEEPKQETFKLDDFVTIQPSTIETIEKTNTFRNTPFISPVYGREEGAVSDNSIHLENTANYEKLDEEIRKTNEFLNTLKELQKKLD